MYQYFLFTKIKQMQTTSDRVPVYFYLGTEFILENRCLALPDSNGSHQHWKIQYSPWKSTGIKAYFLKALKINVLY